MSNNKFDNMTPAQFTHELFGIVRTLTDEKGEIWFVARDVATALGYKDTDQAIRRHCKSPKLLKPVETTGLNVPPRGLTIIKRSDVLRLIVNSKLPTAERFEEWVFEEVLPAIMDTGGYIPTYGEEDEKVVLSRAFVIAQNTIDEQKRKIAQKNAELAEAAPKAALASTMTDDMRQFSIRVAKYELSNRIGQQVSESLIRKVLMADGLLEPVRGLMGEQQRFIPTQAAYELGFCVRNEEKVGPLYFFTLKGMDYLVERLTEMQEAA